MVHFPHRWKVYFYFGFHIRADGAVRGNNMRFTQSPSIHRTFPGPFNCVLYGMGARQCQVIGAALFFSMVFLVTTMAPAGPVHWVNCGRHHRHAHWTDDGFLRTFSLVGVLHHSNCQRGQLKCFLLPGRRHAYRKTMSTFPMCGKCRRQGKERHAVYPVFSIDTHLMHSYNEYDR